MPLWELCKPSWVEEGEPCAKLTKLGWVVGGRTTPPAPTPLPLNQSGYNTRGSLGLCMAQATPHREPEEFYGFMQEVGPESLERSWEIEDSARERWLANACSPERLTEPQIQAVKLFQKGLQYKEGRYRVPPLWKDATRPEDNYQEARRVFLRQEEHMRRTPQLENKFIEAAKNWLKHKWATLVPGRDFSVFFIPTFMVVRIDKATTNIGSS